MKSIYAFCRPGFEVEAGQELVDAGIAVGAFGHFVPMGRQGVVELVLTTGRDRLLREVPLTSLVFTRDWFAGIGEVALPASNRVEAVVSALLDAGGLPELADLQVQVAEANQDRDLHRFARKWTSPLARALREKGLIRPVRGQGDRLEVLVPDFDRVWLGYSLAGNRSPFPGGRPRLKMPAQAPSRSTLKLEEAWHTFIGERDWYEYLGGGKRAVDLGAAPGGWTWQLVNQGMQVTAVDNGPMDPTLMASGQVQHLREDGFAWRPRKAVDWLVCDIVDKPSRTIGVMQQWLMQRLCRFAVFNLKLPMKSRYAHWIACRDEFLAGLQDAGIQVRLQAKHLYHDREEITCFVERLS